MAPSASSTSLGLDGLLGLLVEAAPHRAGALEIGARSSLVASKWRRIDSEISSSPSSSVMPRTPVELRPLNTRTSATGKRMHWPLAVVSRTSSRSVQICTSTIASPSSSFMAILPLRLHVDEIGQLVAPHVAGAWWRT